MGKRELLIALAFGVAILAALQLTAPSRTSGGPRFSLATLLTRWRDEGTRSAGRAERVTAGTISLGGLRTELRLTSFGTARLVGEVRSDVAWELRVDAWGSSDPAAQATAAAVELVEEQLGDTLSVRARYPGNARVSGTITLRVPSHLHIRIEDAREFSVANVAAVRLDSLVGNVSVRTIAGAVSGTHRNGTLRVEDAGAIALTLVSSRATLLGTRGNTAITARNGETRVEGSVGTVAIESSNENVAIVGAEDAVRISATGGRVHVERPRGRVDADSRRAPVRLILDTPVPVTAVSRDATLGLELVGAVPIELDALAIDSMIVAETLALKPDHEGRETTLRHIFGDKARVSLRSERGDIVIASR